VPRSYKQKLLIQVRALAALVPSLGLDIFEATPHGRGPLLEKGLEQKDLSVLRGRAKCWKAMCFNKSGFIKGTHSAVLVGLVSTTVLAFSHHKLLRHCPITPHGCWAELGL
jgi:hypothetical protein